MFDKRRIDIVDKPRVSMGERGDFQEYFPQKKRKKIYIRYDVEANKLFEQYFHQLRNQAVPPLGGDALFSNTIHKQFGSHASPTHMEIEMLAVGKQFLQLPGTPQRVSSRNFFVSAYSIPAPRRRHCIWSGC